MKRKSTAFRDGKDIFENIAARVSIDEVIKDKDGASEVLVLYGLNKYLYREFGEYKIDFRKFINFCKDMDIDYFTYSNHLVFRSALSRVMTGVEECAVRNMIVNNQQTFLYKICVIDEETDVLEMNIAMLVQLTILMYPSLEGLFLRRGKVE